jgi:nicotinate phosphoribosyltransferase
MYLLNKSPALLTDMYELVMAQVYFERGMNEPASFEVTVRKLPENWGFFVSSGHVELESFLNEYRFAKDDIAYLRGLGRFSDDFLKFLELLRLEVRVRMMPEGTGFFPNEPVLEVFGPLIQAQLLESYILNILGFSIIEAGLAQRYVIAAGNASLMEFGLRRSQGPVSALRAVRGAQIAGFAGTSNVFAAREFGAVPSGTMAHSFVQAHVFEVQAFKDFARLTGENAILLVDTYDSTRGIRSAGEVARQVYEDTGVRIAGIRLDSGNIIELAKYARDYFDFNDLGFLKIFVSGSMDEFKIADLMSAGAPIDGFGVGTSFSVSHYAPDIDITYKLTQYAGRDVYKKSPGKETFPGRKKVIRIGTQVFEKDQVIPFENENGVTDLLEPFRVDELTIIQQRLKSQLSALPENLKTIRNPGTYPVEIHLH